MPLYEYECASCKKVHEIMQKFSDPVLTECLECKGPMKKLMSLSSFSLKGSGWYTTDYKRAGSKGSSSESGSASDSSRSPDSAGSSSGSTSPATK